MIRAIALDDELPALDIIDAFCRQIDGIDLQKTFHRTSDARHFLEENPVDLLFTDINMPAESGLDFCRTINPALQTHRTLVIFTTAHMEYAVESYSLQALDYLLKPFTFERFKQAVARANEQIALLRQSADQQDTYLFFRIDYRLVKVTVADIQFIEGLDNYLKIHLLGQKTLVVRMTMKALIEKLPSTGFVRVHRSYIIALRYIATVRNKFISIGNEEIPISGSYEADFNRLFTL
ncbi:LytR/AlgR family response regulator transcription factor [Fibrella forsythiae]|uniref:Response regulator transcription factor n=1 Tax=Fibrella forsythiae TaxID=2817061 RepID=A0ABS3JRK5_9BACT|nr:LytTR family DNA-binding domain-containing protein [Fibrella forsythiae]MBO0952006.1 response regulator transcription factor [Fibrella forsythiae]